MRPPKLPQAYLEHFGGKFVVRVQCRGPERKIDREEFARLYLAGRPMKLIAIRFRCTVAALQKVRKELGIVPRSPHRVKDS